MAGMMLIVLICILGAAAAAPPQGLARFLREDNSGSCDLITILECITLTNESLNLSPPTDGRPSSLIDWSAICRNYDDIYADILGCEQMLALCEIDLRAQSLHNYIVEQRFKLRNNCKDSTYDQCTPNPCKNGGKCSKAERPLKNLGMDFTCTCNWKEFGGFYCDIEDPCGGKDYTKCPPDTLGCYSTNVDLDGKMCWNQQYEVHDGQISTRQK